MSRILEAFTTLYPDQIWLEVSLDEIKQKWPLEQEYSYDVARWNAFLNRLTLDVFLRWLEAESGIEEQPEVWPSREDLPSIWEVVNGTAIKLGETRIVLIPSGETDTNEFCVPAEWVDIPSWAADYYLAVQVNPDDCWLRVWGYTTHNKLKAAEYSNIRRTYSLEQDELIEDLNVMWVARSRGGDLKAASALPSLSPAQAENLLEQLSQPSSYSPRFKVDFAQWGAFIENETLRQGLHKRRSISQLQTIGLLEDLRTAPPPLPITRLSQWLKNQFSTAWQSVESLLATQTGEPASNFREAKTTAKRAKLIGLGSQLMAQSVVLVVKITPTAAAEMEITVGVQPSLGQTYLPAQLQLAVLDEGGASVMVARANSANKNMQLHFSGEPGETFSVKVTLGDVSVIENFVI